MSIQRISPFLWFNGEAEEAARFYTGIFRNSSIQDVAPRPANVPGPSDVMAVSFMLDGISFVALNGGPGFPFTQAVSLMVNCKDQAEIDYYWDRLTAEGGQEVACGWLRDKFGFSWQIVPEHMPWLMSGAEPQKSASAMGALMSMKKLDIAALNAAYEQG